MRAHFAAALFAATLCAGAAAAQVPRLPYSDTREAHGFVFVSGQLAFGPDRTISGDITAQTNLILDRTERLLAAQGLGLKDVVKATVWITNAADFPAFNAAYRARMPEPLPTRSTVVSGMVAPGALIEIEVLAARPAQ
jgi:enamine deaminase RidA (YjgF/YER057c/UK114 family)